MGVKKRLAHRIVRMYHGGDLADRAQADFETQFQKGGVPSDLPIWRAAAAGPMGIKDLLVASGLAASGSAAWRAVDQGAVSADGEKITDRAHRHPMDRPFVLRLGRKMIRVEPA
jgi:tyrosyl-tRNA synthetase